MYKTSNSEITALFVTIVTVLLIYLLDKYAPHFASLLHFSSIVAVLARTFIIFLFSFIMLRLLGKKQLSNLTFIDLLIIIALGSAVGDVMIYSEDVSHLMNSVIAIGFITIMVITISKIIAKHVSLGRLIEGRSTVIVKNGKIIDNALISENMNEEELKEELRERGVNNISKLEEVTLEPNGGLSIRYKKKKRH